MMARFLKHVDRNGAIPEGLVTPCWNWLGGKRGSLSYGGFWINGKPHSAHRVSYALFVGRIPKGLFVLHSCDNPSCVNPKHLFTGNHLRNMADRNAKGRQARGNRHGSVTKPDRVPRGDRNGARKHPETRRGERNGRAKLTRNNVIEIREGLRIGRSKKSLAESFGVSRWLVTKIERRELWAHV